MGKKGKKTRWRRLPITGSEDDGGLSIHTTPPDSASDNNQRITFNEDEYTKITTPRQDVLFKKGYFGRKRIQNPPEAQEVHSADSVESESYVNEEPQYLYTTPAGYVDPTSGIYYVNGNSFETYDPYTGTVTVVVGPAPQYPPPGTHPVLTAVQCQPVPLQPLEWFGPSAAPWSYSCARRKRYSTDSQNCSGQSSESTGPPGSPQESLEEGAGAVFSPQYVYAGYMYGPPFYNVNGISVQGVIPQSPPPPSSPADISASKRRKKRRRRRRGGVTDDGSESSCEEPLICDIAGGQSATSSEIIGSQSGESSDAGPGSGCSKTNSDSGVNTEATVNSGANSPPLQPHIQTGEIELTEVCCDCSLPSKDSFTNSVKQETEKSTNDQLCSQVEVNGFDNIHNSLSISETQDLQNDVFTQEENIHVDGFAVSSKNCSEIRQELSSSCEFSTHVNTSVQEDISTNNILLDSLNNSIASETAESNCTNLVKENSSLESTQSKYVSHCNKNYSVTKSEKNRQDNHDGITPDVHMPLNTSFAVSDQEVICNVTINAQEQLQLEDKNNRPVEIKASDMVKVTNENPLNEELNDSAVMADKCYMEDTLLSSLVDPLRLDDVSMTVNPEQPFSKFSSCRDTTLPVPPPRRKKSLCRVADRVATRLVEEAIVSGMKEAACSKPKHTLLPITEAVTRWLQSQGNSVLSSTDTGYDEDESEDIDEDDNYYEDNDDDEGIVDEESTDQKNVYGNPFLVSYLSGIRTRVADNESTVSSTGEWDLWDHNHQLMCDPARSVDKYYRLGADVGVSEKAPPSVIKTAVHIHHAGPFPCGVCCIIQ